MLSEELVLESLCVFDSRNPHYFDIKAGYFGDEMPKPREKECGCDACFYGRDRLALEIIRLRGKPDG